MIEKGITKEDIISLGWDLDENSNDPYTGVPNDFSIIKKPRKGMRDGFTREYNLTIFWDNSYFVLVRYTSGGIAGLSNHKDLNFSGKLITDNPKEELRRIMLQLSII